MTINSSDSTLFPFRVSLSFDGDLTRWSVGPATGVVIPLLSLSLPFSYLVVVFLDFLGALAVERSFFADCRAPAFFEAVWQNSEPWASSLGALSSGASSLSTSSSPQQDDPWFPPGIGISLVLETPYSTKWGESSAAFIYQFVDFPRLPAWILPAAALLIYYVCNVWQPRL